MGDEVYLTIESIDLLTRKEAEKLPKSISRIGNWWWLQDAGVPGSTVFVNTLGNVNACGTCSS